ncbi:lipoyl protein ligase domain-containing protein [Candidatus Poriferisodalis sp.]|uniref:lipoyl protein ligase domain-containing protein n=1 Tax=Candidatus Poriferisodalis sp. TaxID=3101277 RepID=UPI003B596602
MGEWIREKWQASAELLHARPMPQDRRRHVSWLCPTKPALILGSATVDPFNGTRTDVVRRRSGGGLVWLDSDACTWVDVFVPADDQLWRADVGEAFDWLGRRLAAAFSSIGVLANVHRGPYEAGPSGGLVCFASLGPGEVAVGGRKLVGISQRRTREGSRFQCLAYERFDLGPLAPLLDAETAAWVRDRAVGWADLGVDVTPSGMAELVVSFITAHDT